MAFFPVGGVFTGTYRLSEVVGNEPEPVVRGVVTATLFQDHTENISPLALISVFGENFTEQGVIVRNPVVDDATGRLSTYLGNTCLEIDGFPAPLLFVGENQINAQTPKEVDAGMATVRVVRNCRTGNEIAGSGSVTVETVNPFFFIHSNGIVIAHDQRGELIGTPNMGNEYRYARGGEIITLYGTGFGDTVGGLETGQIPGVADRLLLPVRFEIGKDVLEEPTLLDESAVLYAGAAPCCAGLHQFSIRLPVELPSGYLQVAAYVDGAGAMQFDPPVIPIE